MLEGFRDERVPVLGATLAIHRRGAGRAFCWGHGVTSSIEQEQRAGLRPWSKLDAGWEVVLVDARGHGASSADSDPSAYRWPSLARDLLAVADALGHERFVAGGASMGAATAIHAAVAAPARVQGLVLMIPPTAWETRAAQSDRYRADADLVARDGLDALVAVEAKRPAIPMFEGLFDPGEMARARLAGFDPAVLAAILRGAADSDLPASEVLSRLGMPVLLLAWEGDDGHPLSTAERLANLLPDATLQVARRLADLGGWSGLVADFCAGLARRS